MRFNPAEKIIQIQQNLNTDNEDYLFAALGYFLFLSVIVLWLKRDNQFIKHHAQHGFVLFILLILAFPFWYLPLTFGLNLGWIPNLLVTMLMLWGMLKALSGQFVRIPIISRLALLINV